MSSTFEIKKDIPLKEFNSWKVGGSAQFYCTPRNQKEIEEAYETARKNSWPVTILGGGTNVLVSDEGVKGLVVHTLHLNQVAIKETETSLLIEAEGGTPKAEVLKHFMRYRLAPAIFLAGLPGDMAGGVVMNAGVGHKVAPREFCEIVQSVDVLEYQNNGQFKVKTLGGNEIEWSYRRSKNWQPGFILKVRVEWPNQPHDEVLKAVREGNKRRKDTQPLSQPSCGSVFKNPEGDYSGRLIEATGLRGFSIGGAQVSEKHANFIVNTGEGTAQDIHDVIVEVQRQVKEKHGIELTNEVVYQGDWGF